MTPSPIQKEVQAQLVKWILGAILAVLVLGLMSLANRNVYSKQEVDDRDAAIRLELQHDRDIQAVQHSQILEKLVELKADLAAIRQEAREGRQ